jgi:hypothetical protein
MTRQLAVFAALFAALPLAVAAADKRAATIADLYRVHAVAEPAIAPDGRSVAFTVTTTDLAALRQQTNLCRSRPTGRRPAR